MPDPDRGQPPAVLADPAAPVWQDERTFLAWLTDRGHRPSATERAETVPDRRRRAAVARWALEAEVTAPQHPAFPDWRRLRDLGVL